MANKWLNILAVTLVLLAIMPEAHGRNLASVATVDNKDQHRYQPRRPGGQGEDKCTGTDQDYLECAEPMRAACCTNDYGCQKPLNGRRHHIAKSDCRVGDYLACCPHTRFYGPGRKLNAVATVDNKDQHRYQPRRPGGQGEDKCTGTDQDYLECAEPMRAACCTNDYGCQKPLNGRRHHIAKSDCRVGDYLACCPHTRFYGPGRKLNAVATVDNKDQHRYQPRRPGGQGEDKCTGTDQDYLECAEPMRAACCTNDYGCQKPLNGRRHHIAKSDCRVGDYLACCPHTRFYGPGR